VKEEKEEKKRKLVGKNGLGRKTVVVVEKNKGTNLLQAIYYSNRCC
jgi:hypothetical protein